MPGPPPALAACRVAVRRWVREHLPVGGSGVAAGAAGQPALVLVACSGGADSLALAAAAAFVGPREGLRVGAVVVDHGLQEGSGQVAAGVVRRLRGLGLAPVELVQARVPVSPAGPEADARTARYAVLEEAARRLGAAAVLVGHTLEDQAEQVLLGLVRGSGARSLSGMPAARALGGAEGHHPARPVGGGSNQSVRPVGSGAGLLGRPLLGVGRAVTEQACAELGWDPWADPHNSDPRYARVRVRRALAELEADLGPGLPQALARTADLLRDDAEALDEVSETAYLELGEQPWPVSRLHPLPRAVRTRLWRRLALAAGSPGTDLTSTHLLAVDGLVTAWRGQGPLTLPGGVRARREGDRVCLVGPA